MTQTPIRNRNLLILAFALLMHLAGGWWLPLLDRDEPRFAEASREMRERNDWVVPYFNNQYRFDKPPLVYWLQIAAAKTIGESDVSVRLPSVFAAAATALAIYGFGRRWRDEPTGFRAALIFTCCLQTLIHAKLALADMLMIAFSTLALWGGWELLRNPEPRFWRNRWWWVFYMALGLAFLAKGPVGWLPLILVAWSARDLRRNGRPSPCGWLPGILIMFGVVALWGIPALVRTEGEYLRIGIGKHVVARSIQTMDGHGAQGLMTYLVSLPFYLLTFFMSFFPWCLKTAPLWRTWRAPTSTAFKTWDVFYLSRGILIVLVIFTLVKTKLPHYTLPAFPALCLLVASLWSAAGLTERFFRRAVVAMVLLNVAISLIAAPILRPYFPTLQILHLVESHLTRETELATSHYEEPSLVWYLRARTHKFLQTLESDQVLSFIRQPGSKIGILPSEDYTKAESVTNAPWQTLRIQGWNPVVGKHMDLTVLIREK